MVLMAPEKPDHPALAPGQHVLARLRPVGPGRYEGRTISRIAESPGRILGIFRASPEDAREAGRIQPTDRRAKAEWTVPRGQSAGAETNEIVLAEPLAHDRLGLKPARVIERLGHAGDARAVSLIAIAGNAIPHAFAPEALAEAEAAHAVPPEGREDLRALPLVTIDGADARDFDDAVFAEPDGAGFRLVVAIADVAHYVRPGSALDQAARERGNSVYFPDRVVPMLPEALSNHWCSLRPGEDRGCLFAEIRIAPDGATRAHRFGRGLMRSAARLTYEQAQQARDGLTRLPDLPSGLLDHLYAAFAALSAARAARGTLDLDLPERQVILHPNGRVADVRPRPRLDSHRLIEEFMIAANVAAAETLIRRRRPTLLRLHPPPDEAKIGELREVLGALGLSLPPGNVLHPRDLDRVLRLAAGRPDSQMVSEIVLRAQSQASYGPDNIGHFGLALRDYAHFTSPIRRYADLVVHRGLIDALGLGPDGQAGSEDLEALGAHLTATERRAQAAEREAIDRYLAAFLSDKVGWSFPARVSGVTRFGVFVTLAENGASGIVPRSSLPDEWFPHEGRVRPPKGGHRGNRDTGIRLGQEVEVRLAEATPATGGLVFHLMQGIPPRPSSRGAKPGKRSRRR
ncbi:MAG: VacB/RNase II family 3'-5' exoribonuclease [Rhodospirillales bacterium]|nr:VacB/RNase II family 3'-5' exoribonuclease [Rhodospirillales bacterium]